jgi:galactokinase
MASTTTKESIEAQRKAFFSDRQTVHAKAHGRVNLIGEHTDYNDGFVLPTPIPQAAHVWVALRDDDQVTARSAQFPNERTAQYRLGDERRGDVRRWTDYLMGATLLLAKEPGVKLGGFGLFVDSDVPVGSGLSSSAALEVAVVRALREAFQLTIDDVAIAYLCQRIENEFVGARVGIMDQMVASVGEPGEAMFLDVRAKEFELLRLPGSAEWVVVDSGVPHDHAAGDYNTRRSECEQACAALGVSSLRDLSLADLPKLASLPEPLNRRAKHVVTENQRVLDAKKSLLDIDLPVFGALMNESHVSQRDDYEVSVPAIDTLVTIAQSLPGVLGARLTGGGFGGSIVALAPAGSGVEIGKKIVQEYHAKTGVQAKVLTPV